MLLSLAKREASALALVAFTSLSVPAGAESAPIRVGLLTIKTGSLAGPCKQRRTGCAICSRSATTRSRAKSGVGRDRHNRTTGYCSNQHSGTH
jgi:hypothetical protein